MTKKILLIGASGKVGGILVSEADKKNLPIVGLVRDKRTVSFPASIRIIEADLENTIDFISREYETIVFSAGSGAGTGLEKTLSVDLWGAAKVIDASKCADVKHFIMVSSRGADNPDNGPDAIKPYLIAKHFADEHLKGSGLNFTILRPGRLTDDAGKGLFKTQRPANPEDQFISRKDTAHAIMHCLNNKSVYGKIYELYEGDEPIENLLI